MIYVSTFNCQSKDVVDSIDFFCENALNQSSFPYKNEILFALHEASMNALEEAATFFCKVKTEIQIKINVNKDFVFAEVCNYTSMAFNLDLHYENKDLIKDLKASRGRGLLFIKELVDDVWQETDEMGRCVLCLKKIG